MSEAAILELIEVGRQLSDGDLNAGTAGNLSALIGDQRMVISKRRTRKASLTKDSFLVFDFGRPSAAMLEQASTEFRLHVACYQAGSEVRSVLHTHSPALTAIGFRRSSFPPALPELETVVGSIAISPFEPSGSQRLADDVGRAVGRGAAVVILKRHGVVTVGRSIAHALDRLELAENAATTILLSDR